MYVNEILTLDRALRLGKVCGEHACLQRALREKRRAVLSPLAHTELLPVCLPELGTHPQLQCRQTRNAPAYTALWEAAGVVNHSGHGAAFLGVGCTFGSCAEQQAASTATNLFWEPERGLWQEMGS